MKRIAIHKLLKLLLPLLLIIGGKQCCADTVSIPFHFYHGDHLGSASWITNGNGTPVQHLQYMPYGEPFVNERTSSYNERFTFTGKERDSETGLSYFGARYYDSDLMTGWLSVDPLADKYPSLSPYAYCGWNPIKLVDPDGRMIGDYYDKHGNYLGWDGNDDYNVYIVTDRNSILKIKSNNTTPLSDVKICLQTNCFVLRNIEKVLNASIDDNAQHEFGMTMQGIFSSEIRQGEYGNVILPDLPNFEERLTVSIHSHPDADEKYGHWIEYMSYEKENNQIVDAETFQKYDLNVIVGQREIQFEKGAAFYGRQPKNDLSPKEPILTISKTALSKMANGQISAILKRVNPYE